MTISYDMLPEHMKEPAQSYIERGNQIGDFLTAVLSNNLVRAVSQADMINRSCLREWSLWLYNEVPPDAWGSAERVKAWQEAKGLVGLGRLHG